MAACRSIRVPWLLSRIGPLTRLRRRGRSPGRPPGERDQDDLGALAAHAQDAVAMFVAQVGDVGAGGFEDPQAQQPGHGDQGKS